MECGIVELRRYALRPGARETLIELFDREFVESQEEVGMQVLGQFRDLDDPDAFVWLRGFSDMGTRKRALEAFYGGPVWKHHASAANATMVDVGNVLLLRPVSGLELDGDRRPPPGGKTAGAGLLVVTIYPLRKPAAGDFPAFFQRELEPALRRHSIPVIATYATEHSRNTYPALPVRGGEEVLVWMTSFADAAEHARHAPVLDRITRTASRHLDGQAEVLRLSPTGRSLLQGSSPDQGADGATEGSRAGTGALPPRV